MVMELYMTKKSSSTSFSFLGKSAVSAEAAGAADVCSGRGSAPSTGSCGPWRGSCGAELLLGAVDEEAGADEGSALARLASGEAGCWIDLSNMGSARGGVP